MKISEHILGLWKRPFLTAEIGGNHSGDFYLAQKMVKEAAKAKVSAVKFQAYKSSNFLSSQSPYYSELAAEELPFEELSALVSFAHELGICAGLTVFCGDGINLALDSKADFIKISSGDIDNYSLLEQAQNSQLPLIISTGASSEVDVRQALKHLKQASDRLIIMQCTSVYPADPSDADLLVMKRWLDEGLMAGYSDHTLGTDVAKAALAMGAIVLEKHFTIDKSLPGGDNSISVVPAEMRELVQWAELCSRIWGIGEKHVKEPEKSIQALIRRTWVANRDMQAGSVLSRDDLALKRPSKAGPLLLSSNDIDKLVGAVLNKNIKEGSSITLDDIIL